MDETERGRPRGRSGSTDQVVGEQSMGVYDLGVDMTRKKKFNSTISKWMAEKAMMSGPPVIMETKKVYPTPALIDIPTDSVAYMYMYGRSPILQTSLQMSVVMPEACQRVERGKLQVQT